jgi:hypothetical protein
MSGASSGQPWISDLTGAVEVVILQLRLHSHIMHRDGLGYRFSFILVGDLIGA